MKKDFVINRQGKDFVLYAGLLDQAHEKGLQSLVTESVALTSNLAVFKATATFADGRVFVGHGDATPENVGRNIAPHFLRMGETRAKARALRDALNISAASLEEMGDEDGPPAPARARAPQRTDAPAPREEHRNGSALREHETVTDERQRLHAQARSVLTALTAAGVAVTAPAKATTPVLTAWLAEWAPQLERVRALDAKKAALEASVAAARAEGGDTDQDAQDAWEEMRREQAPASATGELRGPRWGDSELGKEVSRMVDEILTLPAGDAARRFVLPANSATDEEVEQWIASKKRLLQARQPQR